MNDPAPPNLLILPGWTNSGPQHWQSLWERKLPNALRIEQQNWDTPRCEDWVSELDSAISNTNASVVLIAHSLGCVAIIHWAASARPQQLAKVRGAFLVAPADVERPDCMAELRNFAPIPQQRLPFASLLIASSNDPYCSLARAKSLAASWGSEFHNLGDAGHINAAAGFGEWPEGETLLATFTTENDKLIAES